MRSCTKCPHSVANNPENEGKRYEDTECFLCNGDEKPNYSFIEYIEGARYDTVQRDVRESDTDKQETTRNFVFTDV